MDRSVFNESWLEELKSKNDIVSVISQYIRLERKGRNFWGCCPFHNEKTPSFCVNDTEQFYHCFGCKESGDVIRFIEKRENCDFLDAINILAKRCGMEVPSLDGTKDIAKRKQQKERIMLLLNDAKEHYRENLLTPRAKLAQDYVKERKITGKELKSFELGYSFDWTEIISYLEKKGYTRQEMKDAGVIEIGNKGGYDVYAERLIFPIFNSFGEVIGFSARALQKTDYAKYKNTAKTLVFDKSNVLFGIQNIRRLKQENNLHNIILVEGQMDVIAMCKAGFENTIATLGTALTPGHARLIKRYTDKVIVCYDGDEAGIKATLRSIDILLSEELEVKVVSLPNGQDPDELIKEKGRDALVELIGQASYGIDYKIKNCARDKNLDNRNEKSIFIKDALAIISNLKNESEKQLYLDMVRKMSGMPVDILRRDLDSSSYVKEVSKEIGSQEVNQDSNVIRAVKFILASGLFKKPYVNHSFEISPYVSNNSYIKLQEYLKKCNENNHEPIVSSLFDMFDIENEPNINDIINYNFDNNDSEKYYNDCIWTLKESFIEEKQRALNEEYKTTDNRERRKEIVKELYDLAMQKKKRQ